MWRLLAVSQHNGEDWSAAFAPASVGNVAVGFDLMGHALEGVGDRVRVRRSAEAGVRVSGVTGVVTDLPLGADRNTAAAALQAMREGLELSTGFELELEKGVPLGSGMGGSGASAAAAVVAANALHEVLDLLDPRRPLMNGLHVPTGEGVLHELGDLPREGGVVFTHRCLGAQDRALDLRAIKGDPATITLLDGLRRHRPRALPPLAHFLPPLSEPFFLGFLGFLWPIMGPSSSRNCETSRNSRYTLAKRT